MLTWPCLLRCFLCLLAVNNRLTFWVILEFFIFFSLLLLPKRRRTILYFTFQAVGGLLFLSGLTLSRNFLVELGCIVKLGLFPFHHWILGVLTGRGLQVIFFLGVFSKYPLYNWCSSEFCVTLAVITLVGGSFLALWQPRLLGTLISSGVVSRGILVISNFYRVLNLYFGIYALSFALLLFRISKSQRFNSLLLFNLMGFPPLPLFFAKLSLLSSASDSLAMVRLLLTTFLMAIIYYVKLFKFISSGISILRAENW